MKGTEMKERNFVRPVSTLTPFGGLARTDRRTIGAASFYFVSFLEDRSFICVSKGTFARARILLNEGTGAYEELELSVSFGAEQYPLRPRPSPGGRGRGRPLRHFQQLFQWKSNRNSLQIEERQIKSGVRGRALRRWPAGRVGYLSSSCQPRGQNLSRGVRERESRCFWLAQTTFLLVGHG